MPHLDRLVIFDIGATLVTGPSRGPWSRIADRLALTRETRQALRDVLMTSRFETPAEVTEFLAAAGADRADAANVVTEVWTAQTKEAQALDGALATLNRLREDGVVLALISNIWAPYLESVRSLFGEFFDREIPAELQFFSFREGVAKPSTVPVATILRRSGMTADATLMVGDSYAEDIAPAIAQGVRTLWLLHRPQREASDLVRVLNGSLPRPTAASRSIAEVDVEAIFSM
ncbi:HAD family hydrolase [Conexibacter woesei]|uniref:HAD family hydrolase n=1 Tax=Conexibacter woesei TaxID=191495 RepID=UPI000411FD4A|nr:HAD family hydrolase [Conexibacter woesei]